MFLDDAGYRYRDRRRCFGLHGVIALRKTGGNVEYLREEDRRGVVIVPGFPGFGIGPAISYPDPDC